MKTAFIFSQVHLRMKAHSALFVFIGSLTTMVFFSRGAAQETNRAPVFVKVGVLLDESRQQAMASIACLNMAISDFYSEHPKSSTRVILHRTNSTADVITAAAGALDLIRNVGVATIVGPPTSMQADFVIRLGEKAHVPVLTFSASNPYLTSVRSPYFFRATQNDATQTKAISAIMQAFNWLEAVPIYVDNEFGQGILHPLADALVQINARIPFRCPISPQASDDRIKAELYHLMSMSTRVYVVHMGRDLGRRLFSIAKRIGMMSKGYVWIITDSLTNFLQLMDPSVVDSMQGVIGVRPFVNVSRSLDDFETQFLEKNPGIVNATLTVYDFWGYDTVTALAMAVEKVQGRNLGEKQSLNSSASLNDLPVSVNGELLLEALSNVKFTGLTGDFKFVDGELPPATYQIVNINGSVTPIGYWTGENGLAKELPMTSSKYDTSSSSLSRIAWPGNPTFIPKGWDLPTEGKKLQILVPVKEGDHNFVKVTRDETTNATIASGFSIDVFDEVVKALPYALPYDYIPFAFPNGTKRGTYDEMILQVSLQNYDAAVGDITIVPNRSKYVDFSMPYTESGVSLVVRSSYGRSRNPKIFLLPFSNSLWVVFFFSFVFIAILIGFLERNINSYFSGRLTNRIGTPLWYSFMMMVSAQGDNIVSNYARAAVVVWSFVIMILIQSYTASLSSLLTVQQLQPISTDATMLMRNKETVGYSGASFIHGMLRELGFEESKLIPFKSLDDCHDLFETGTIVAAFAETPYLKSFLSTHCNVYTTKHAFQTAGFGFVFPKGSPLTNDVSRAVLQVVTNVYSTTMNDSFSRIENKWFASGGNCSESATSVESSPLQLNSFKYLFIAAFALSLLLVTPNLLTPFIRGVYYSFTGPPPRVGHPPVNLDFDPRMTALR